MQPNTQRALVVLALLVAVTGAVFVEARWLRAALVVIPALFLAQRAVIAATAVVVQPTTPRDRRSDMSVRQHIQRLLDLIRDFYSTCHMVAVGQLSPAKAKEKARDVEAQLNQMMKDMLERIEADEAAATEGGSDDEHHAS